MLDLLKEIWTSQNFQVNILFLISTPYLNLPRGLMQFWKAANLSKNKIEKQIQVKQTQSYTQPDATGIQDHNLLTVFPSLPHLTVL